MNNWMREVDYATYWLISDTLWLPKEVMERACGSLKSLIH